MPTISKKIILLGHFGVGKTSLVRRFVYQKFSDEYLTTIGVKVDKKEIEIDGKRLVMIIWDIEGGAVQSKLPKSYFLGAAGIIYVFDMSRASTYEHIEHELDHFRKLLPLAKVKIVGNKSDLLDSAEIEDFKANFDGHFDLLTSAKTGDRVEELFHELGVAILS